MASLIWVGTTYNLGTYPRCRVLGIRNPQGASGEVSAQREVNDRLQYVSLVASLNSARRASGQARFAGFPSSSYALRSSCTFTRNDSGTAATPAGNISASHRSTVVKQWVRLRLQIRSATANRLTKRDSSICLARVMAVLPQAKASWSTSLGRCC